MDTWTRLTGQQAIRILTIRADGWAGVPNLFKRWLGRPLDVCLEFHFAHSIEIPPGETARMYIGLKEGHD